MKANELRIGNHVKGIGHNISWLVEGIEGDFIYSSKAWRLLSSFEGIQITEEELINLGFKTITNRVFFKKDIGYEFGFTNRAVLKTDNGFVMFNHIQYVHQLQNLYFALTGEELTYKC